MEMVKNAKYPKITLITNSKNIKFLNTLGVDEPPAMVPDAIELQLLTAIVNLFLLLPSIFLRHFLKSVKRIQKNKKN